MKNKWKSLMTRGLVTGALLATTGPVFAHDYWHWSREQFLVKSPPAMGRSEYDDYTILIVIHFTRSDMGKPEWHWTAFQAALRAKIEFRNLALESSRVWFMPGTNFRINDPGRIFFEEPSPSPAKSRGHRDNANDR